MQQSTLPTYFQDETGLLKIQLTLLMSSVFPFSVKNLRWTARVTSLSLTALCRLSSKLFFGEILEGRHVAFPPYIDVGIYLFDCLKHRSPTRTSHWELSERDSWRRVYCPDCLYNCSLGQASGGRVPHSSH